jgi:dihydrofolate reductase
LTAGGSARPRVSLIAAVAANGVIGRDGRMPWHLPEDLKRFKALTMGHAIVMGRKTFDSIGRLLPGRRTIIVTRQRNYRVEGAEVVHSVDDAIALARGDDEIFVIGGGEIYVQALPRATRLHMTEIDTAVEGDVRFPPIQKAQWHEVDRESRRSEDGTPFAFVTYERKTA